MGRSTDEISEMNSRIEAELLDVLTPDERKNFNIEVFKIGKTGFVVTCIQVRLIVIVLSGSVASSKKCEVNT